MRVLEIDAAISDGSESRRTIGVYRERTQAIWNEEDDVVKPIQLAGRGALKTRKCKRRGQRCRARGVSH